MSLEASTNTLNSRRPSRLRTPNPPPLEPINPSPRCMTPPAQPAEVEVKHQEGCRRNPGQCFDPKQTLFFGAPMPTLHKSDAFSRFLIKYLKADKPRCTDPTKPCAQQDVETPQMPASTTTEVFIGSPMEKLFSPTMEPTTPWRAVPDPFFGVGDITVTSEDGSTQSQSRTFAAVNALQALQSNNNGTALNGDSPPRPSEAGNGQMISMSSNAPHTMTLIEFRRQKRLHGDQALNSLAQAMTFEAAEREEREELQFLRDQYLTALRWSLFTEGSKMGLAITDTMLLGFGIGVHSIMERLMKQQVQLFFNEIFREGIEGSVLDHNSVLGLMDSIVNLPNLLDGDLYGCTFAGIPGIRFTPKNVLLTQLGRFYRWMSVKTAVQQTGITDPEVWRDYLIDYAYNHRDHFAPAVNFALASIWNNFELGMLETQNNYQTTRCNKPGHEKPPMITSGDYVLSSPSEQEEQCIESMVMQGDVVGSPTESKSILKGMKNDTSSQFYEFCLKVERQQSIRFEDPDNTISINFSKGEMVGKGSFGKVYQCINVANGEFLALKEIPFTEGPKEQQIRVEVETHRRLSHRNVINFYGCRFDRKNKIVQILMEFAPKTLRQVAQSSNGLPMSLVAHYARKILRGIAYLHDHNIVHRDIKAMNVLVTEKGDIKISDFGTAFLSSRETSVSDSTKQMLKSISSVANLKRNNSVPPKMSTSTEEDPDDTSAIRRDRFAKRKTNAPVLIGTPLFLAPELLKGGYPSESSDMWAFGCMMIELVTGKNPWQELLEGASLERVLFRISASTEPPELPLSVAEKVTEEFKDFLYSALAIEPGLRPSAKKLLAHPFLFFNHSGSGSHLSTSMSQTRNPSIFSTTSASMSNTLSGGTMNDSLIGGGSIRNDTTDGSGSTMVGSQVSGMGDKAATAPEIPEMVTIVDGEDAVVSPSTAAATSDASTFLGTY